MTITVLGCGISGLSTAIALRGLGLDAHILAEALPPHTTSDKAGALCFPLRSGPRPRVLDWAAQSLSVYDVQAQKPESAVREVDVTLLCAKGETEAPWQFSRLEPDRLREALPDELPQGYDAGFVARLPLIETSRYLKNLMVLFREIGGTITQGRVETLEQAPGDMVVNCTGLGARALCDDQALFPISGHILKVKPSRPMRCIMDEASDQNGPDTLTYIFPRPDACVLGGTAVDNDWDETPKEALLAGIAQRTFKLEPALADAELLEDYVCLRPGRPTVRLEEDALADGRRVIHNYGHGGSGWTLAWGCAAEVAAMAKGSD